MNHLLGHKKYLLFFGCVFLLLRYSSGQGIILDNPIRAGELTLFQSIENEHEYLYLLDKARIATDENNTPQFSFLRYVQNAPNSENDISSEGTGGGIVHALVTLEVTDEQISEARRDLRRVDGEGKIVGPALYQGGRFSLVSTFANPEGGFSTQVLGIGSAPILDGQKAAISLQLTKLGAKILWESFKTAAPDISFSFEMDLKGYRLPKRAIIEADFDQIYDHKSFGAGISTPYLGVEIQAAFDEMVRNGAIKVTQIGDDDQLNQLVQTAYNKISEMMFEPMNGSGTPSLADITSMAGSNSSPLDKANQLLAQGRQDYYRNNRSSNRSSNNRPSRSGNQSSASQRETSSGSSEQTENNGERSTGSQNNSGESSSSSTSEESSSESQNESGESTTTDGTEEPNSESQNDNEEGTSTDGTEEPNSESQNDNEESTSTDGTEEPNSESQNNNEEGSDSGNSEGQSSESESDGGESSDSSSEGNNNQARNSRSSAPSFALVASFKMKKVKQTGKFRLDLNKYTTDEISLRFDENIGNLSSLMGKEAHFHQVNLDDPFFRQRQISTFIDGYNASDFGQYINFVSVRMEKKHENGDITNQELRIDRNNFNQEANLFPMVYGWKDDKNRRRWMEYKYEVLWSFFGGTEVKEDFKPTTFSAINLKPPYERRTITLESDPEFLKDQGVRSITVSIFYKIGEAEEPVEKTVTLNVFRKEMSRDIDILLPSNNFNYEYEIKWRLRGNKVVSSGRNQSGESILFVDELPEGDTE